MVSSDSNMSLHNSHLNKKWPEPPVVPLTKNNGPISWPLRNQDRHPGFRINWFLFRKKRSSKNYQISKGQRVVESKSLKVGKSIKIGKNRIKSEKSDFISYQTFFRFFLVLSRSLQSSLLTWKFRLQIPNVIKKGTQL